MYNYDEVIEKCKEKIRYGDLWKDFTVEELILYGFIKAKRGKILYGRGMIDYAIDDLFDAINILIMGVQKIGEENG